MRSLSWTSVRLVVTFAAVMSACGCGADDAQERMDAVVDDLDALGANDAGPTPPADGLPPQSVADFDTCTRSEECQNANSQCISVYYVGGEKQCLPSCAGVGTSACPFDSYCYLQGEVAFPPNLEPMKDHCWFSLCGEVMSGGSVTGGACRLGAEMGMPESEQLDGWCMAVNDGEFGLCLEVGTQSEGGACELANPVRGGQNCDAASICWNEDSQAAQGACRRRCDPATILTRTSGNSGCPEQQDCGDASTISTLIADDNGAFVRRATLGFCIDATACRVLDGAAACPPLVVQETPDAGPDGVDAGTSTVTIPQGCVPTNPVRPTGICDATAAGDIAVGAACPAEPGASDAEECTAGSFCVGDVTGGEWQGSCQAPCDRLTEVDPCASGLACTPLLVDSGADGIYDTTDDNLTADWGICLPPET